MKAKKCTQRRSHIQEQAIQFTLHVSKAIIHHSHFPSSLSSIKLFKFPSWASFPPHPPRRSSDEWRQRSSPKRATAWGPRTSDNLLALLPLQNNRRYPPLDEEHLAIYVHSSHYKLQALRLLPFASLWNHHHQRISFPFTDPSHRSRQLESQDIFDKNRRHRQHSAFTGKAKLAYCHR